MVKNEGYNKRLSKKKSNRLAKFHKILYYVNQTKNTNVD